MAIESVKKPLKLFHCTHDGKVIFGISVVLAKSKKTALTMLKNKLTELYIDARDSDIDITELDVCTAGVHVLFDGVY